MIDDVAERLSKERAFWRDYLARYPGLESLTTASPERTQGKYVFRTIATLLNHVVLEDLERWTVMDFGCGTGRLAKFIAPLCQRLICVDISQDMLDLARQKLEQHSNVEFVLTTGSEDELPVPRVDFAYSYAVLPYMRDAQRFWKTIAAIDHASQRFCLQLHKSVNESPRPDRAIENVRDGQLYDVEGYRPSVATIARHYPGPNHWLERHRPDVRGREPFFYKAEEGCPGLVARIAHELRRVSRAFALQRRPR